MEVGDSAYEPCLFSWPYRSQEASRKAEHVPVWEGCPLEEPHTWYCIDVQRMEPAGTATLNLKSENLEHGGWDISLVRNRAEKINNSVNSCGP